MFSRAAHSAAILALFLLTAPAEATTILNPLVVIKPGARDASVKIANELGVPMTYRMSLVDLNADNSIAAEDTTIDHSARNLLRFAPRQVTVPAHQAQVIRILVTRPPDLPAGAYKSYLRIEEIPSAETTQALSAAGSQAVAIYMAHQIPVTVEVK